MDGSQLLVVELLRRLPGDRDSMLVLLAGFNIDGWRGFEIRLD
jgi:hypothetical protein